MNREITLDALIKQLKMNGGKTAPIVAESLAQLKDRIESVEHIASTEIFREATAELYRAGCEISNMRGQYKKNRKLIQAISFGYVSSVVCMIVFLVVQYG